MTHAASPAAEPSAADSVRGPRDRGVPRVRAVVLNWNAAELTARCVESLLGSEGVDLGVRIVDNGSADGSAARLVERFGATRVVALEENRGYAGGMNAGIEAWLGSGERFDWLLLVTQDVTVAPDAVARMAAAADGRTGIVGPVVHYRNGRGLMSAGFRLRPRTARIVPVTPPADGAPYAVDTVDGCFLMVRRAAVEAAGGLDERFFMYFEEADLCRRVAAAGWEVRAAPAAHVRQEKPEIPGPHYFYYMSRNRYLFWRKSCGIGPARVTWSLAEETARMLGAWARDRLRPPRHGERPEMLRWCGRQLRGWAAGARDYARGRFGKMPVR